MTSFEDHPPIPNAVIPAQPGLVALKYHHVGSGAGYVERRPVVAWCLNDLAAPRPIPAGPAPMRPDGVLFEDGRVIEREAAYETYADWMKAARARAERLECEQ